MSGSDDDILITKEVKFLFERNPRKFVYSRSDHKVLMAKIRANKSLIAQISEWLNKASDVMQDVGLDALGKKSYLDTLHQLMPFRDPKVIKTMGPEIVGLIERDLLEEMHCARQERISRLYRQIELIDLDLGHSAFSDDEYYALLRAIIGEKDLYEAILHLDDAFWDGIALRSLLKEITEQVSSLSPTIFSTLAEDDEKKIVTCIIADIARINESLEPDS